MTHPDTQAATILILSKAFDHAARKCGTAHHAAHHILQALHDAGFKVVKARKLEPVS